MVMQVSRYSIVFINALWGVFITNKSSKYVLFYKPQGILRSEYKVNIRLLDSILKQSNKFVQYIAQKHFTNFTFT